MEERDVTKGPGTLVRVFTKAEVGMWMAEQPNTKKGGRMSNGLMTNGAGGTCGIVAAPVATELQTGHIVRRAFYLLLQDGGITKDNLLQQFRVDLRRMNEEDARIVRQATESLREVLLLSENATILFNVRDFEGRDWGISEATVYTEFHRVFAETFREGPNWGKVIAFLSFAVSYAVFALRQGLPDATVQSIHGWTAEMLRRRPLSTYIINHDGWVRKRMCLYGNDGLVVSGTHPWVGKYISFLSGL